MFCKNCGNELNDKAVICTKCGCAVGNINVFVNAKPMDTKKAFKILNCITFMLLLLSFAFLFLFVLYSDYYTFGYYNIGYKQGVQVNIFSCFVSSICVLGTAIASFVLSFRSENKAKKIISDVFFSLAIFLVFISTYACVMYKIFMIIF